MLGKWVIDFTKNTPSNMFFSYASLKLVWQMDAARNRYFSENVFPIVHLSSESVRCCGQQTLRHLILPLLTALTWILDFEFLRIFVVAILDVCCGPSSNLSFMAISVSGRGEILKARLSSDL